jgi:hypothetical protein
MNLHKMAPFAAALVVGAAHSVSAADMPVKAVAAAPVGVSPFYMSAYGQFLLDSDPKYRVGILAPEPVRKNDGLEGGILAGWRFASRWDASLGFSAARFREGSPVTIFNGRDKARYYVGDLNFGYTFAAVGGTLARLGIGVRHAWFEHQYTENVTGIKERYRGTGPRGTLDVSKQILGPWLVAAGVGGGPLFGNISSTSLAGTFPMPSGSQTVWNLDGYAGLGYQSGLMSILAGWRGETWTNLHSVQFGFAQGRNGRTAHGPFIRLSFNAPTPGR